MNVLFKRNKLQQLRLFLSVDDFPHMLTGEFAVLDFELVGKDVVDAQFAFEEVAEIGEAARQNGGAIAVFLEGLKEALGPFGKRETVGHFLHHAFVESLKQRHALLKTRSEEHTSELQSRPHLVCRLLLEKKKSKRGVC